MRQIKIRGGGGSVDRRLKCKRYAMGRESREKMFLMGDWIVISRAV